MNMLIVKKFGGTSVADKDRIFNVAKRCIRDYEAGNDVVVVLSAMENIQMNLSQKQRISIQIHQKERWICSLQSENRCLCH